MKKLLLVSVGAVVMELLAMEVTVMRLPAMSGIIFSLIAAALFVVAIWEKPKPDERDEKIIWQSSHIAFLAGTSVLAGILAYQTIYHIVEPWTLISLSTLILGKIIGRAVTARQS